MHEDSNGDLCILKLDRLLMLIGEENDAGTGGHGILGQLARIEHKFKNYDRIQAMVAGALTAAGLFLTVLWYILKDKVDHLLGIAK